MIKVPNSTSNMMKEICRLCDITHTQTPAYNPKSNPVERSHRDLNLMIKAMIIKHPAQDWEEVLPACLFAIRTARNRATGFTPHFLLFGREASTLIDLIFPITGEKYGPIPYINKMRDRIRMAFRYVRENLRLAVERSRRTYNHSLQGKTLGRRRSCVVVYPKSHLWGVQEAHMFLQWTLGSPSRRSPMYSSQSEFVDPGTVKPSKLRPRSTA